MFHDRTSNTVAMLLLIVLLVVVVVVVGALKPFCQNVYNTHSMHTIYIYSLTHSLCLHYGYRCLENYSANCNWLLIAK